jgi:ferredoxin-like protein FixX
MKCFSCEDTGSLQKELHGFLDCTRCDVAEERMRVEAWARRAAPTANLHDVWIIYQHGKTAALNT